MAKNDVLSLFSNFNSLTFAIESESFFGKSARICHASIFDEYFGQNIFAIRSKMFGI